jgi:hypothetical protein
MAAGTVGTMAGIMVTMAATVSHTMPASAVTADSAVMPEAAGMAAAATADDAAPLARTASIAGGSSGRVSLRLNANLIETPSLLAKHFNNPATVRSRGSYPRGQLGFGSRERYDDGCIPQPAER